MEEQSNREEIIEEPTRSTEDQRNDEEIDEETTGEPRPDSFLRLTIIVWRFIFRSTLFRSNKQGWMSEDSISESIAALYKLGATDDLVNGSVDRLSQQSVNNLLLSEVKVTVVQSLRGDTGPLKDLDRELAVHLKGKALLDVRIHRPATLLNLVHVIMLILLTFGALVLAGAGSASILHLSRRDFYYFLPNDLHLGPVELFSDILLGCLWVALFVGVAMAAYSGWKAVESIRGPSGDRRWIAWSFATLVFILLAATPYFHRFDSNRIEFLIVNLVVHQGLAYGITAGIISIGLAIVPVRWFLNREIHDHDQSTQDEISEQRALLARRDAEYALSKETLIRQQIQAAIISLGEGPAFNVVPANQYGLTVPEYDVFGEHSWQGLTENYDLNYVNVKSPVDNTSYLDELKKSIDELKRGSFGISGERGAGKTSLMYALRDQLRKNTREYLDVWLGAPTAINEETFLLSVLAKLATRVGSRITGNRYFPHMSPENELREKRIRRRNMTLAFAFSAGVAIVGLATLLLLNTGPLVDLSRQQLLGLTLPMLALGPIFLWGWRWGRKVEVWDQIYRKLDRADINLIHGARSILEQLWFDQRESVSSSAGISGLGVDFSGGWSQERTRRPFTLPQLSQMWDDFVHFITTELNAFGKVVIFIDEVDKIKDTEEIDRFMRILKTLYRPSNLFFVVSISEDAYELYQKRSVARGQRNVFDSSFDQFTQVTVMTSDELLNMLRPRIVGEAFSRPFIQLIWLISRGNPRDCVRYARDLVQLFQKKELSEAAPYLITKYQYDPLVEQYKPYLASCLKPSDYQIAISATENFSQALIDDISTAVECLEPLRMIILQRETAALHKGQANDEADPGDGLWKFGAGLYITYTLRECYGAPTELAKDGRFEKIHDSECLKTLKDGHQALHDGDPFQAWTKISEFRDKAGLGAIEFLGRKDST